MNYIAYLHKDSKSDYGVSFPDFPGCITAGKTLQEAQQMAEEALSLHIQGMIEDGEAIPEPSSIDALANDPARESAVAFWVQAELPDKAVRINITAREKQIEKIDRLAREAGMTRSAYFVHSALHAKFQVAKSADVAFGRDQEGRRVTSSRAVHEK
jgi:predicted RNase H-like HicB family nuclease